MEAERFVINVFVFGDFDVLFRSINYGRFNICMCIVDE